MLITFTNIFKPLRFKFSYFCIFVNNYKILAIELIFFFLIVFIVGFLFKCIFFFCFLDERLFISKWDICNRTDSYIFEPWYDSKFKVIESNCPIRTSDNNIILIYLKYIDWARTFVFVFTLNIFLLMFLVLLNVQFFILVHQIYHLYSSSFFRLSIIFH